LPFLAADEQRDSIPSAWRVNGSYRSFRSSSSPIFDADSYSIGALLNQSSVNGWSWTGVYTFSNNKNIEPIGNDFAYSSQGINLQLSKSISPKLSANGGYGFTYSSYTHPDSVTRFTQFRVNKFQSISLGLNYSVNDSMRLFCSYVYQRNNSNLPTGFILSTQDVSTAVGIQSPSLGDYHKYGITAGLSLNF
jgi:outer membrane protein assembly factor BamA